MYVTLPKGELVGLEKDELALLSEALYGMKGPAQLSSCTNECPSLRATIMVMEHSELNPLEASMLLRLLKKFEETKK